MNTKLLTAILLLFAHSLWAGDTGKLSGKIQDLNNSALPFVSILLKQSNDSVLYKVEVSNEQGEFIFEKIAPGNYYLEIQNIGFEAFIKKDLIVSALNDNLDLGVLTLSPKSTGLKEITVMEQKPFIERLVD